MKGKIFLESKGEVLIIKKRGNLDDEDLKTLGESFKRLRSLQSVCLGFDK